MKLISFSTAVLTAFMAITSCGGSSNSGGSSDDVSDTDASSDEKYPPVEVTVEDPNFAWGDLKDYIELVPGKYSIVKDFGIKADIKVKVKGQTDDELSSYSTTFVVADENGNSLGTMHVYGGTTELNKALSYGDTSSEITLTLSGYDNEEEIMKKAKFLSGYDAIKNDKSSSSSSSSSSYRDTDDNDSYSSGSGWGSSGIDSSELKQFISNGKSGDIDKMISALEWYYESEAKIKPSVRALDEDAIKMAAELNKASEEIGDKYDCFSLAGALDSMTDDMSSSQLSRYNSVCGKVVLYFTASEDASKFNDIYRKYRYGW